MNEALKDENWVKVIKEKLDQFVKTKVWMLVSPLKHKAMIGAKWIHKQVRWKM